MTISASAGTVPTDYGQVSCLGTMYNCKRAKRLPQKNPLSPAGLIEKGVCI